MLVGCILHHVLGPNCSFFNLISVGGLSKKKEVLPNTLDFPKLL